LRVVISPKRQSSRLAALVDMTLLRRVAMAVLIALAAACLTSSATADEAASYVGAQTCAGCHSAQFDAWKGSHHALAMQPAAAATVLGDFAGAQLERFGVTTTFFRDGDRFMVRTDGPDGALHEYPIAYTFGVYPLQQYLIAMPGGRLQALGVAWDSRPKEQGGHAGSTSIPIRTSNRATRCTGPGATRPGTTSAPIATPLT
jgi:hypothetical protein